METVRPLPFAARRRPRIGDFVTALSSFAARKAQLPELPPRARYTFTVADVVAAVQIDEHRHAVQRWAQATWNDWADQHAFIRQWARRVR